MADFATFVFTDLVGSVDLKSRVPGSTAAERDEAYVRLVLTPHREIIERGLAEAGGRVVSTAGDGHFLVFPDTAKAASWALGVQATHETESIEPAPDARALVRIGIHAGVPQRDPHDAMNFIGRAVDYASRLADQAQAGQVLASRSVASLLEDAGLATVSVHSHGRRRLRGIGEVELFEVLATGSQPSDPRDDAPPPDERSWTVLPATMGLTEYHSYSTAASASSTALSTPQRLGNYELGEMIGAGGMGNVYKARHSQFGKLRAIKLIKPELMSGGGESAVRRFYQEVRATGSLEHPNLVVAIDSSSPKDSQHYLVMEYIDGIGVDGLLTGKNRLSVGAACEIARQAALGLEHLAAQGLVHRDVKPSNLMLTLRDDPESTAGAATELAKTAVVKLMDLGLALLGGGDRERITRVDHGGMGTGYYMSPEQWRTTSVDIRADIYSLGCTLFHLVTGAPPFAESDLKPQKAHEREPTPRASRDSDASPELDALLQRMMAKKPDDRPQRPLEVALQLEALADRESLTEMVKGFDTESPTLVERPVFDTRAARQAVIDARGQKQRGSTLSKAAEHARWIAPTLIALVAGVVAVNLAWLFNDLRDQMLAKHQETLVSTASTTADYLAGQIERRFEQLEDKARSADLIGWMEAINTDPNNGDLWTAPQQWIVGEKSRADSRFKSDSWFITDKSGVQIARAPPKSTIGDSFAFRDYFHGQGYNDQASAPPDAQPTIIIEDHLSRVYASSKTGELKVAFSTPIYNGKRGRGREVIGLLAMSVELGQFKALEEQRLSRDERDTVTEIELLLADLRPDFVSQEKGRGLVLHHRSLRERREAVRLTPELIDAVTTAPSGSMLGDYADPFGRPELYWGAVSAVKITSPSSVETNWVIIAQEPRP